MRRHGCTPIGLAACIGVIAAVSCRRQNPQEACSDCIARIHYENHSDVPHTFFTRVKSSSGGEEQRPVTIPAKYEGDHEYHWDGVAHIKVSLSHEGEMMGQLMRNNEVWHVSIRDTGIDWGM